MKNNAISLLLLFSAVLSYSSKSLAIIDLIVLEELKVYKKRSVNSKVLTVLSRGDKVVISQEEYGRWKKVLITYNGKRRGAFVESKAIRLSLIRDRDLKGKQRIQRSQGIAVAVTGVFQMQDDGELLVVGFEDAKVGSRSGFDSFYGFHYHYPVKEWAVMQFSFNLRSFQQEGEAELSPSLEKLKVRISQDMYSVGGFLKIYRDRTSYFWTGFGFEIAQVQNLDIETLDGRSMPNSGGNPLYVIFQLGIGWDIQLTNDFYLIPGIKGGVFLNSSPKIYSGELTTSLAWLF